MFTLISAQKATMWELKNCYTLDEALKLYALYDMAQDIQRQRMEEMRERR